MGELFTHHKTLKIDSMPTQEQLLEQITEAYDVSIIPMIDKTSGYLIFQRTRTPKDAAILSGSPNSIVDYIDTDGIEIAGFDPTTKHIVGHPYLITMDQLDAQAEDSGLLLVIGSQKGAFTYTFTLGAGTSGVGTLYGSNDGVVWTSISATASLVADGTGVMRWDDPWAIVKFEFTTQVGAGSTFDGSVYAL